MVAIVIIVLATVFIFIGVYVGSRRSSESGTNISPSKNSPLTVAETKEEKKSKDIDLNELMAKIKSRFPTVKETKIYTEENDPNNNLGKPGFYTAGAAFWDERTNYTPMPDENWATDAGGSIEVYESEADSLKRAEYLKSFQGNGLLDPGRFEQVGSVVVRASSNFSNSQQTEIIDFLVSIVR